MDSESPESKKYPPRCGLTFCAEGGLKLLLRARAMPVQIIPVIMCGGAGTRLWPVSRESMPKQFVPLLGAKSTFQQVVERIRDPDLFARPIIITLSEFRFIVAEQLREIDAEAEIVLEPM